MHPNRRRFLRHASLAGMSLLAAPAAPLALAAPAAGQALAGKVIKLVVPLGPGGTADILARLVAQDLGQTLQATVVVENRPGAGGAIGSLSVARAAPDGLTLCLANASSHAISPAVQKERKYHPVNDFTPVGLIAEVPVVLVTSPLLNTPDFNAWLKLVRSQPNKYSYGTPGVGTLGHMMGEQLKHLAGIELLHVPYKSMAEVSRALLAGEVACAFDNLPVSLPQIRAGRVVLLGTTGRARNPEFPDTPTFSELGYDALNAPSWFGVVAPAGTPPDIQQTLHAALASALAQPALAEKIQAIGGELVAGSAADFGQQLQRAFDNASNAASRFGIVVG